MEVKGWLCLMMVIVFGSDFLIVVVLLFALYGASLSSDAVCSFGNYVFWMLFVVGVGGDFLFVFVNVCIIFCVVIFV